MKLLIYLLRRILLMIPVLLGITIVTFLMLQVTPGGPVDQMLEDLKFGSGSRGSGMQMASASNSALVSKEVVEIMNKQYGFDKPLWQRYGLWLEKILHLDFGKSFVSGEPVSQVILSRFPVSIQFGLVSLFVTTVISIGLGVIMAKHKDHCVDSLAQWSLLSASSLPPFVLALVLLVFFSGGRFFDFFPLGYLHSENYESLSVWGKFLDRAHHFVLPATCYVAGAFAEMAFLCRNSMVEELGKDYIRTARSKGLKESVIYFRHALRNALLPVVTGIGGFLGLFLSGSILIETIFRLDGIGLLAFQSVLARDYNVVMALTFLQAVFMLLGNLMSDVIYLLVDPRIDFD